MLCFHMLAFLYVKDLYVDIHLWPSTVSYLLSVRRNVVVCSHVSANLSVLWVLKVCGTLLYIISVVPRLELLVHLHSLGPAVLNQVR